MMMNANAPYTLSHRFRCWASPRSRLRDAAQAARAGGLTTCSARPATFRTPPRSRPTWSRAPRSSPRSREEWQSNDLEEARRDAIMANIKLKTALALMEQEQLKAKIQTLPRPAGQGRGRSGRSTEKLDERDREGRPPREVHRGADRPRTDREGAPVLATAEAAGRAQNGSRCSSPASRRSPPPSSPCAPPTPSTRGNTPRPSTARPATCWRRPPPS